MRKRKLKLKRPIIVIFKMLGIVLGLILILLCFYFYQIHDLEKLGYSREASKNILLAKKIKESIDTKREIQEINNMYFNKLVTKPGVLVELGFLSNSKDRNNLINEGYQNRITDMIVDGIINYFKM